MQNHKIIKSDKSTEEKEIYIVSFSEKNFKDPLEEIVEIKTEVDEAFKKDLELFEIIPESADAEKKQKLLEGYIIKGAKQFVRDKMHQKEQNDQGKFTDMGGPDNEF